MASSKEDTTELSVSSPDRDEQQQQEEDDPTPEDLECVRQIRRVTSLSLTLTLICALSKFKYVCM